MMPTKEMKAIGVLITNRIKGRIRDGKITPTTSKANGGKTLKESGKLMRSIKYKVTGNVIVIGTNVKYGKIHHFGGVIKPKKAKYLAIPLTPAAKIKRPRDWEDTFIAKGIIFRNVGPGKIEALYKLQKSVTIPARPYMFIDSKDKQDIQQLIIKLYETKFKS